MSIPGRNDPCPCGSGRKYKYCCLHHPPSQADGPISWPPPDEIEDDGPAARMMEEFIAERGDKNFDSMEQLQAEFKAFMDRDNARPREDFEGLSPDQMNAVLYAPLNSPGIIKIAERVEAGPDIPILMMLDEMRQAIFARMPVKSS